MFGDETGDVGCNSYELWEKDLECIQQLGLTHYRLSLSWARLLPDGTTRHVNQKGTSTFLLKPCYIKLQNNTMSQAHLMVVVLFYFTDTFSGDIMIKSWC